MSATLENVTKKKPERTAEQVAAEELVRRTREQGLSLTGPDGLLKQLTKVVIETALDQELTEHLGHEKNTPAGNQTGNVRNGARPKTVLTGGTGQVGIEVPRDRDGTFEPQIVRKRQRRLNGVDEIVLSLYAEAGDIFVRAIDYITDPRITGHEASAILEGNATALFGITTPASGATAGHLDA